MNLKWLGMILTMAAGVAYCQPSHVARPEFEVASIKRNMSGPGPASFRINPGGRLDARSMPLRFLIWRAYELPDFQASGGPDWVDSERYDIAAKAKANGDFSPDGMLLMLRTLLEDRFGLTFRPEMREQSVFILTIAKSGLRMQHTTEASCVPRDPKNPVPQLAPGTPLPDYCGDITRARLSLDGSGAPVGGTTLKTLAGQLSSILDRPVVDKTGLTGVFDFHLQWTPLSPDSIDGGSPSIFTALQEQLGLKLESGKDSVEMLAIDRVEKPGEN